IWELVLHMTAWKNETRRRLGGAPAGEPAEGDWPRPAGHDADRWREALDALGEAHRALMAAARQVPEAQLFASTNDPRNLETGEGVTFYALLHGIVQHDVYHAGQIALLKKGRS
ncbi:MAG: DinB family protein, partial [Vicinamibacterales bacterium]